MSWWVTLSNRLCPLGTPGESPKSGLASRLVAVPRASGQEGLLRGCNGPREYSGVRAFARRLRHARRPSAIEHRLRPTSSSEALPTPVGHVRGARVVAAAVRRSRCPAGSRPWRCNCAGRSSARDWRHTSPARHSAGAIQRHCACYPWNFPRATIGNDLRRQERPVALGWAR